MGELRGAAAQPRRPEVLHGDDARVAGQLETGLHQAFLEEGVADLHGGTSCRAAGVEHDRREAGAVNPVAAGVGADEQHEVAGPARLGADDAVVLHDPDAHRVDQAVRPVRLIEVELATDSRHADAVAVAADAGDDAVEQVPLRLLLVGTEAE